MEVPTLEDQYNTDLVGFSSVETRPGQKEWTRIAAYALMSGTIIVADTIDSPLASL